jgi:Uma2 family endonuclease
MAAEPAYVPRMLPTPTPTPTPADILTAEQLLDVRIPGKRVELVRGRVVVKEPPGYLHADITARLAKHLMDHTEAHELGRILIGDAGFKIAASPDTVRGPDIAFIQRDRVPHPRPTGYAPLAPDLVVEVLSPSDRPGEVLAKVGDWLEAGTRLVWVIDPGRRAARVYRHDGTEAALTSEDALDGEDVLTGFSCLLASLLQP